MPTDDQLKAIMPRLADARRQQLLPFLQAAVAEFEIGTPAREAAFLAQLAHESGQLRFMEEIWGPTDRATTLRAGDAALGSPRQHGSR